MQSALATVYAPMRRIARSVLRTSTFLDSTVGNALRRFERRVPLAEWYVHGSDNLTWNGFTLNHTSQDIGVVVQLRLNGDYEPETRKTIEATLKPGMTFVDLGAHIGYYALIASRAVGPSGRVIAFEPTEKTRETLALNCRENGFSDLVQIEPLAISDKSGTVSFACEESSTSNKIAGTASDSGRLVELQATSLDDYFRSQDWPSIDLIKMDIEGAELSAMQGMAEVSARNPNLKLIFEYLFEGLVEQNVATHTLFEQLRTLGFKRFHILYPDQEELTMPDDIERLEDLGKRLVLNILAEK